MMTSLRQEALQIVNDVPDDLLAALVQNLKTFTESQFYDKDIEKLKNETIDPKKAAAFAVMEELRVRNRKYFKGVDLEKAFLEAIDEKFGSSR